MTAHRGVLHPDEYVAPEVAHELADRLGATVDELRHMYGNRGGGPLPRDLRDKRARVDAILADSDKIALLARHLRVPIRALQRGAQRGAKA